MSIYLLLKLQFYMTVHYIIVGLLPVWISNMRSKMPLSY